MTALSDPLLMQDIRPTPARKPAQEPAQTRQDTASGGSFDAQLQKAEDDIVPRKDTSKDAAPSDKSDGRLSKEPVKDAKAQGEQGAAQEAQPPKTAAEELSYKAQQAASHALAVKSPKTRIIRLPANEAAHGLASDAKALAAEAAQQGLKAALKGKLTEADPTKQAAEDSATIDADLVTALSDEQARTAEASLTAPIVIETTEAKRAETALPIMGLAQPLQTADTDTAETPLETALPPIGGLTNPDISTPRVVGSNASAATLTSLSGALTSGLPKAMDSSAAALATAAPMMMPTVEVGALTPAAMASLEPIQITQGSFGSDAALADNLGSAVSATALGATQTASSAAPTAPSLPPIVLQTQSPTWVGQLSNAVTRSFEDGTEEFEVTLTPENLGRVQIRIGMREGVAALQIVTETAEAAKLFDETKGQLEDSLRESGLDLGQHSAQSQADQQQNRFGTNGRFGSGVLSGDGLTETQDVTPTPVRSSSAAGVDLMA